MTNVWNMYDKYGLT